MEIAKVVNDVLEKAGLYNTVMFFSFMWSGLLYMYSKKEDTRRSGMFGMLAVILLVILFGE